MPDADPHEFRQAPPSRRSLTRIGIASILLGLMANAFASDVAFTLQAEPVGARIRPIGEILLVLFATLLGVCGAALASVPIRERSTRRIGLVGFILGLTPLPLGLALMDVVIRARHLDISP